MGFAHGQMSLTGTVKQSRTGLPIPGATVKVLAGGSQAMTDADGHFSITGASGIRQLGRSGAPAPGQTGKGLRFRKQAEGPVSVRILDLNGKEQSLVFSGRLASGVWEITPPALAPGAYFCTFESPAAKRSIPFFASPGAGLAQPGRLLSTSGEASQPAVGKRAAETPVDTLLVTKAGFMPVRVPIPTYQQSDLAVLLEDTSSSDADEATWVPDPSWTCFMPAGIPPPSLGDPVFTLTLQIGATHDVGLTKFGKRRQYDIQGGTITGDKITGTAVAGGLDYDLTLSNGSVEVEQIVIFRANNIPILMRNAGIAPSAGENARVVLDFEAPNSSAYTWLHTGKFAATRIVDTVAKTIKMDVFEISKVTAPTKLVTLKDPANVPNQTWECFQLTGGQGATVFTENVTLGTSISIGASKRGSRNIIPISGGTTTGKVVGKILDGGADYQLGGLDARYTLAPNDGEFIIVRNCGANGLVPVFEARVDGPYNFLNENKYLSSAPGVGGGGVSITFYEKK